MSRLRFDESTRVFVLQLQENLSLEDVKFLNPVNYRDLKRFTANLYIATIRQDIPCF